MKNRFVIAVLFVALLTSVAQAQSNEPDWTEWIMGRRPPGETLHDRLAIVPVFYALPKGSWGGGRFIYRPDDLSRWLQHGNGQLTGESTQDRWRNLAAFLALPGGKTAQSTRYWDGRPMHTPLDLGHWLRVRQWGKSQDGLCVFIIWLALPMSNNTGSSRFFDGRAMVNMSDLSRWLQYGDDPDSGQSVQERWRMLAVFMARRIQPVFYPQK